MAEEQNNCISIAEPVPTVDSQDVLLEDSEDPFIVNLMTLHEAQRRFRKLKYADGVKSTHVGVVQYYEGIGSVFRAAHINGLALK